MYITDFEYAGRLLSEFNCMVCHVGSDSDLEEINIGCDITFTTVKNNHSSVHSVTSSTYDNVYTTSFDIAKNFCELNDDNIYFNEIETREIIRWLNRHEYKKFKPFDLNNDISNIVHYGSFNVMPLRYGENVIALRVEFTSNAPYGFAEPIQSKYMILAPNEEISIYGDSDEITTIFPTVQIRCFSSGDLEIENYLTGNKFEIKNCINGETITVDGEYKIIDTTDETHLSTIFNDYNYSDFDILVDEHNSENRYKVSLPCEITVSYSPIRKVGVF